MPFNGSGGTSQPVGGAFPAVPSTLIQSAKVNISIADIYTMLASAILKDGQQVATQRVPFAVGISTDTVTEKTADTGVTLDGVLLKDGRIDTTQGSDIVCAATINLETATGNVVDVTGSTGPVTAVTLSQGHWRLVRFTGTPTITNGASLVLPNAADYVVAAGDYILFVGYASSVVRAYILPTSSPIPYVDTQPVVIGSADKTKKIRFEVDGITTATTRVLTVPNEDFTIGINNSAAQTFLGSDVALNNAANYFNICNTGSIGAAGQVWRITGTLCAFRNAGTSQVLVRIWDGSSVVYMETNGGVYAAAVYSVITVDAVVTLSAATTFHLSAKASATDASAITTGGSGTANKATSIIAVRIA